MIARGETVEAEFELPQKLTAGQYYFFVKANNGGATLRMSCGGGGSAECCPVDNDGNGLWSDPIPIDSRRRRPEPEHGLDEYEPCRRCQLHPPGAVHHGPGRCVGRRRRLHLAPQRLRRVRSHTSPTGQSPAQQQFRSRTWPGLAPGGQERTPRLWQRLAVGRGRGVSRPGQRESAGLGQLDFDGDPRPARTASTRFPSGPRPKRRKPRSSSNCPRCMRRTRRSCRPPASPGPFPLPTSGSG